ncbi:hypothetical protein IAU60_001538 [Kwoniella sp. DSM 27419]
MAHLLRHLRLHTITGQVAFLTTVSVVGGLALTSMRDEDDKSKSRSNMKAGSSGSSQSRGDIVDAIKGVAGAGAAGQAPRGVTLADALTAERGASLWWNYARDSPTITARLVSRERDTTIMVPTDKAILLLGRKPHQHPGLSFRGSFSSSKTNTERFLQAHMFEGQIEAGKVTTLLDGFSVQLVKDKGAKAGWRIQPGDIEVLGAKETANGRIIYLNKVIPY